MGKARKELGIKIIILLISCAVSLLLMEMLVRVFIPQGVETPMDCYFPDEMLGWRLKPNFIKRYTAPEYEMEIVTNEKGFRDTHHDYKKPPLTYRILGIGDSFLFGYGIEQEDIVLNIIQKTLQADSPPGEKIEAINLGMPGYGINQYHKLLINEGYLYRPDLVMLFFYANDWAEANKPPGRFVDDRGYVTTGEGFSFKTVGSLSLPLRIFLKRHSQLYILVRGRFVELLRRMKLMPISLIGDYRKNANFGTEYHHTLDLMDKIGDFCKEEINCAFVLCMIPERIQVDEDLLHNYMDVYDIDGGNYDWLQPQMTLQKFCLSNGIYFLDLAPEFKKRKEASQYYYNIDQHWNTNGHLLAAREITRFLHDNRIVVIDRNP